MVSLLTVTISMSFGSAGSSSNTTRRFLGLMKALGMWYLFNHKDMEFAHQMM